MGLVSSLALVPLSNHTLPLLGPASLLALVLLSNWCGLSFLQTRLLGRGLHILIKNVSFTSPIDVGSHNPPPLRGTTSLLTHCPVSTPLQGSVSSLAHYPMSGSDTICNSPLQSMWDLTIHPPLEAQRPCWHTVRCPPPSTLNVLASTPSGV